MNLTIDLTWIYDLLYRGRPPWEIDEPRAGLVQQVESGLIEPCRAIDLGCGTGDNAIFLAQQGFNVVGVDLSPRAVAQAEEKAHAAGVETSFVVGDVTRLEAVDGPFDLVIDFGCLGCVIGTPARRRYARTVRRLTRPGSRFVLLNLARDPDRNFNLVPNALQSGEVDELFGDDFETEIYDPEHEVGPFGLPIEFRRMRRK